MFVTGIIAGVDDVGADHFLGAFKDQNSRGLITPVTYNNNQIFQMMVYSNAVAENNISFRYYSAEDDSVYMLHQTMYFFSNAERGSLDDPYVFTISGLNTIEPEFIPEEYALHPAYPNPFNPVTTISYDLPNANMVSITIYDMLGREVRTLVAASQTAGRKSIRWDGKDDMGNKVAGGMYLCQIHAGNFIQTKKQMLLK